MTKFNLPYKPETLKRELKKYYISSTDDEISEMLNKINKNELKDLYSHLDISLFFEGEKLENFNTLPELNYEQLIEHFTKVSEKNNIKTSFLGDGIKNYTIPKISEFACSLRGLTTAYTPYQPERSQGTLWSLWVFSNMLSRLTGFEAINASLYDRSTGLFEAINTAKKIKKTKKNTFILSAGLNPRDINVIGTLTKETDTKIVLAPVDSVTGRTCQIALETILNQNDDVFGIAFSHTNTFGIVEDVNELTDISRKYDLASVAIIDPILLAKNGLKRPSEFGTDKQGVDIIIGEAQHLALGPNFGGPGLGMFGVRYNKEQKLNIRSTPGRYIGKATDESGTECLSMVLSTREQHIRREKATSNICSNQSFIATIIGACLLSEGDDGLQQKLDQSKENFLYFKEGIDKIDNVSFAFTGPTLNECVLELNTDIKKMINMASSNGIHLGVDITNRAGIKKNMIHLFFNDKLSKDEIDDALKFLDDYSKNLDGLNKFQPALLKEEELNNTPSGIFKVDEGELKSFYTNLANLNVSPDDNIYPLGSCTMKYNPYINDYTASLPNFVNSHPEAPEIDNQGSLEILWEIQEAFKKITGLPGVTTQPVAGAQGELVGIKMFQAYHRHNNEDRDIILIPKSAHGTNPATATMAGIKTSKDTGIVLIDADETGQIDLEQIKEKINLYNDRIIGVMVTNPNTSGIFESNFKEMAKLIHDVGGLVYMDGANMNAIAGIIDLEELGVDAVHNNLHKTWTIPHGGGGPGDAIVAVSEKLVDFLPGIQIRKNNQSRYESYETKHTIGNFHRHNGNFAHKVRCLTYLKALGHNGIRKMSSVAVLSSVYLFNQVKSKYPTLPRNAENVARMHEFIITISEDNFQNLAKAGIAKSQVIGKLGKLFLDFGMHAPTVSFPEPYGLMIEPTESYSKKELDKFIEVLGAIKQIIDDFPEVLNTVPHFTPIEKVNEVKANKDLILTDNFSNLPNLPKDKISALKLQEMPVTNVIQEIVKAHELKR